MSLDSLWLSLFWEHFYVLFQYCCTCLDATSDESCTMDWVLTHLPLSFSRTRFSKNSWALSTLKPPPILLLAELQLLGIMGWKILSSKQVCLILSPSGCWVLRLRLIYQSIPKQTPRTWAVYMYTLPYIVAIIHQWCISTSGTPYIDHTLLW